MPASDEAHPDLDAAAAAYADLVRSAGTGAFDLVLLGMGPDGHVASLFPGFPQLDVVDQIAVPVTGSPKPPPERISLTFAALNRTAEVWFLVSGEGKADAVRPGARRRRQRRADPRPGDHRRRHRLVPRPGRRQPALSPPTGGFLSPLSPPTGESPVGPHPPSGIPCRPQAAVAHRASAARRAHRPTAAGGRAASRRRRPW